MKRSIALFTLVLLMSQIACKRPNLSTNDPDILSASKTTAIAKGEPVTFKMVAAAATDNVHWTVAPAGSAIIKNAGNQASISFTKNGSYNVMASFGTTSLMTPVMVDTTIYNPPPTPNEFQPLTGDKITITPYVYIDGLRDSSQLNLISVTTNKYNCLNSYIYSIITYNNGEYTLNYKYVSSPGGCVPTNEQHEASGITSYVAWENGIKPFNVTLNGVTYRGTVDKEGNHYTFTWPYTDGVVISPLSVNP